MENLSFNISIEEEGQRIDKYLSNKKINQDHLFKV